MLKKIFIAAGILILLLIALEAIKLFQLKTSVSSYATYWKQRASTAGELTYVVLGDSAAQGVGASDPDKGYVGLIAKRLAAKTGKSVRVVNLSVYGAGVDDVIRKQLPLLQN